MVPNKLGISLHALKVHGKTTLLQNVICVSLIMNFMMQVKRCMLLLLGNIGCYKLGVNII